MTTHSDGEGATATVTERRPLHEQWTKAGPVESGLPEAVIQEIQERSEAAIGEPAPMALFGFATGTLLIGIVLAGILPMDTVPATLPTLLVFAGLAQFIGGLIAYRKGNTFGATAFCSFGANNVVVATFFLFQGAGTIAGTSNDKLLLGIDLFCLCYIAVMLMIAALPINGAFVLILLALFPGYGLSAVPDVGGSDLVGHIGGWFLIVSAGLAFYTGGAIVINSSFKRTMLHLFSRT